VHDHVLEFFDQIVPCAFRKQEERKGTGGRYTAAMPAAANTPEAKNTKKGERFNE
jgi:hypothetical protein